MVAKLPADAFQFYVTLGPGRSYQKVAEHFGTSKRTVTKHAVQENWATRLLEAEAEARERSEAKAVETLEAMNERHLKIARALQAKAVKALQELPLDTARDIIKALELGLRQERLVRGEPTDRNALTLEEITKREMTRWLVAEGGEDDEDGDPA
jgi:hypothetical protein